MKNPKIRATMVLFILLMPIIVFGLLRLVYSIYSLLQQRPDKALFRTKVPEPEEGEGF